MKILQLVMFLAMFVSSALAQRVFIRDASIPVFDDTLPLPLAWFGGLNNPMFSAPDLNNDGIADLVVFDKSGDFLLTFINNGTPNKVDYVFSPQYKKGFPDVRHWMLMDDYNCDGITDLFKSNPAKIDVWLGRYNSGNELEFDSMFTLLYNSQISGNLDIFVTPVDIPAIADINGDGDLDVLKLNETFSNPRTVYYYENQSQELNGDCASVNSFELLDECWGNFVETGISLWVETDSCGFFKREEEAAAANGVNYSFLAFDEDGDGDKELLMGLSISSNINRMVNDGTPDSAHVSVQDPVYPDYNLSYNSPMFAVPSILDINNDGLKDLLIAPRDVGRSENYSCAWYYKNIGNTDSSIFEFQTETFLIEEGLDFGEGAYPAFFDYNADGLLDLAVGNYGYYANGVTYRSGLALLENTGTQTSPSFKLVDRDYARVASLARRAIYPAFGDMDNDGDADMFIGEVDGFLHYYENSAGAGNPAVFPSSPTAAYFSGIDVGQFSAPFIYDVNGDTLPDLVVGEKTGNINYFENRGDAATMLFDTLPTNSFLGKVNVRGFFTVTGYAAPSIAKLDTTGKVYLVVGNEIGYLFLYEFDRDSIYSGSFKKITESYSGVKEGEKAVPAIADINADGKMEMIVGNYRGGLSLFSQTDSIYSSVASQASTLDFVLYPNPANRILNIEISGSSGSQIKIELFDLTGRKIFYRITNAVSQTLELPELNAGLYLLKASSESKVWTGKVVIQ